MFYIKFWLELFPSLLIGSKKSRVWSSYTRCIRDDQNQCSPIPDLGTITALQLAGLPCCLSLLIHSISLREIPPCILLRAGLQHYNLVIPIWNRIGLARHGMTGWPGRGDHGWSSVQAAQAWSSCHSPPAWACKLCWITTIMDDLPGEYGAGVAEDGHELEVGFGERQSSRLHLHRHPNTTRLNHSFVWLLQLWRLNLLKHASFTLINASLWCHLPRKCWYRFRLTG